MKASCASGVQPLRRRRRRGTGGEVDVAVGDFDETGDGWWWNRPGLGRVGGGGEGLLAHPPVYDSMGGL